MFKDTQWTVEELSFVAGHKSVSASIWHDLLSKFSIRKEDRVKVIKNLGWTLLDELEKISFDRTGATGWVFRMD
jgi:hypothetical protein